MKYGAFTNASVISGSCGVWISVLLKHLIRLLDPTEGAIVFDSRELARLRGTELVSMRRRFGMLFQSAALFDSLTVEENVGLGLREQRRFSASEIHHRVMEKLEMVGLASVAEKSIDELSGGMKKRVGLARAIVNDPEVLLYDEPTTGLDPVTADVINSLIVELNERLNVTSVAVTHDMHSAFKIADRIVMLYGGKVEFDGTPEQVRSSSNPVVSQFIRGGAKGPIQMG